MNFIKKKYVYDRQHRKIAVQLPLETFEKIEEILEDFGLAGLMKENEDKEKFTLSEAKEYYAHLKKID